MSLNKDRSGAESWILGICIGVAIAISAIPLPAPAASTSSPGRSSYFRLRLRTRVEVFKGTNALQEAYFQRTFNARTTAIVITDMWNQHWCSEATGRVNLLAAKMEPVLERARAAGIQIIHSPSDTMNFYKDYPQRRLMIGLTLVDPPPSLGLTSPPLPINVSADGGCGTPGDHEHQAWTRENPLIKIAKQDVISDSGKQVYSFIHRRGINTVFYVGVHANMCILDRTFGVKQMTNWGIHCVLLRDLTDTMYDRRDPPYVSHADGTKLVIQYIERYWCPTALSADFVAALKPVGSGHR